MVHLIPKSANSDASKHLDPLTCAIAPSADETPEERITRLKAEEQARKLSDDIDKFLKKTVASVDGTDGHRKKAVAVKVLLLGQSECGKSTALKNFQLLYNPQSFQAERAAWRMVILFNLVQSIRVLHTIVSDAMQAQQQEEAAHFGKSPTSPVFGRSPPSDFQDLFPRNQHTQLHRKRSSGPAEWNNGHGQAHAGMNAGVVVHHSDHEQTDAASTYSAGTSSSSTKNTHPHPQRRSSFFGSQNSKEGNPAKESKKSRSRPATTASTTLGAIHTAPPSPTSVSTPMTNAFCLPTQTFGSTRRVSPPSTQSPSRRAGLDEVKVLAQHGSRPSRATAVTSNGYSSSPTRNSPKLSLSIPPTSPTTSASSRSPVRHYPVSSPPTSIERESPRHPPGLGGEFTAQHQLLLMRLKPLLTVELALLRRLSLPDDTDETSDEVDAVVGAGGGGGTFPGKPNTDGGREAPANMTANAARRGPIANRNGVPDTKPHRETGQTEAVKLDFNLAAKEGTVEFSAPSFSSLSSNGSKNISKTTSNPGRPRARSSADISRAEYNASGQPNTTSTMAVPQRPPMHSAPSDATITLRHHLNGNTIGNVGFTPAPGFTMHPSISTSSLDLERYNSRINHSEATVSMPEFFVRSTTNWKEKLRKWKRYDPGVKIGLGGDSVRHHGGGGGGGGANGGKSKSRSLDWNPWDEDEDPAHLIQACASDVKGLWNDPVVKQYLSRNRYKLEHLPGFFLSDVDRIVSREYTPTDDDILRARLKTIGAVEHKFSIDTKGSPLCDWLVYDVGGARTQRAAWAPYFDSVDAIIFIVSLSSFDQSLSEDPSINRMEDSLRSFRDLVGSKILRNVNIILFLNKVDLLESKLNSGVQLSRYFKRYGDRPNTTDGVIKYFRAKFTAIYEKYTPPHAKRVFTIHATSLTNPQSTKIILEAVNESIMQMHIAKSIS